MAYAAAEQAEYYVGESCQLCYRWYDGYDIFVAEMEVRFAGNCPTPLEIPAESLLCDLHLVYQLVGQTGFHPRLPSETAKAVTLPAKHHMEVYAPPGHARLRILPDAKAPRYVLAVVVPKGAWVTRHAPRIESPLEALIRMRKNEAGQHRYLGPMPTDTGLLGLLHLMLTMPSYPGMIMDDELNGPMVRLIQAHRDASGTVQASLREQRVVADARALAEALVVVRVHGEPLTAQEIATALHVDIGSLNRHHERDHGLSFGQYVEQVRLRHAATLLVVGMPVTAVALAMGYSSASNFARSFRAYFKESPSNYRKKTLT